MENTIIREVSIKYKNPKKLLDTINFAWQAVPFIRSIIKGEAREHFIALYLNSANQPIAYSVLSVGTANSSQIHCRELFQQAIAVGAISILVAHNHPSQSLMISKEDVAITKKIKETGNLLNIQLLDHLIVTDTSFKSLQETGLIN